MQKETRIMDGTLIAHCGTEKIGREQLALVPFPLGTTTTKCSPTTANSEENGIEVRDIILS
jgi:hypothetical protein